MLLYIIWDKVFKSGLSKFCGRQPLKNSLSPLLNTLFHISGLSPQRLCSNSCIWTHDVWLQNAVTNEPKSAQQVHINNNRTSYAKIHELKCTVKLTLSKNENMDFS